METQQPATAAVAANQNPPSKSFAFSSSKSFISSGKQRGGATVLGRGMTLQQEKLHSYFSEHKQLGKAVALF
jgi:hypothetical protein